MKNSFLIMITLSPLAVLAQVPDNVGWSPAGATWVYSEFSATTNRNMQIRYLKDTSINGRNAKKMEVKRVEFLDVNLTVRTESLLGYDFFLQSNDSIFLWENNAFKFIFDFSPLVNDKWVVGTEKILCPTIYPATDTITVDSIVQVVRGNRIFDYIYNNSSVRKYVLGPVIKNIGPVTGPYPFVNRNLCTQSSGMFQGLICYRDDTRGEVSMPNVSTNFCHSVITSLPPPPPVKDQSVTVYPNPVRNKLMLLNTGGEKIAFVLYDATGHMVAKGQYANGGINVASLKSGIYFLQMLTKDGDLQTAKFIKI